MKYKLFISIFCSLTLICCSINEEKGERLLGYNWETTSLEEANIDESLIEDAFIEAAKLDYIYSILVIRNGKIAAEKYFNDFKKESDCTIRSVSKSYLSAAYGIAIENEIISMDEKILTILPEFSNDITDNRFSKITIEHLLSMTSGLDSDGNLYSTVVNSSNWGEKIFSQQLINNPGEKFKYTTPGTHLLSIALTKKIGETTMTFMKEQLTNKMNIDLLEWEEDPQGFNFGGNNMFFRTRDMAVLGLLYLNKGKLNGQQLVQESWVSKSIEYHTQTNNSWGPLKNIGYGYLWWLGEVREYKIFTAIGHGGQFVFCVPDLNLIVATNAHSNIWWEQANIQELAILNVIGNYIVPATRL